jgi:hypothetical protein
MDYRHFDNAASRDVVCILANRAWSEFTDKILQHLREGDPRIARADFGALMHAVEDFYSHSNWLETGQRNLAPIIPACAGLGLLGTLQTGFFRPDLYDPISGCPMDASGNPAPPAPFMYCHLTLHKDAPIGHDADMLPEGGKTFHQAAVDLAIADTQAVYNLVRTLVTNTFTPAHDDLSGTCMADLLFGTVTPPFLTNRITASGLCLDLSGVWRNVGSNPPDVGGVTWTLTQVSSSEIAGYILTETCGILALHLGQASVAERLVALPPEKWKGAMTDLDQYREGAIHCGKMASEAITLELRNVWETVERSYRLLLEREERKRESGPF